MAIQRTDEVLAKVLETDEYIIPRYDVVLPNGAKVAENATIVLKNSIEQEGVLFSKQLINEMLAASGATTGTSSALVLAQAGFTLFDGAPIYFRPNVNLSGPCTINVNAVGAISLKTLDGNNPKGILANSWVLAIYSAELNQFIVQMLDVLSGWKLLQAYTVAGTYTFVPPEGITELGAFIIGGGGSGGAAAGKWYDGYVYVAYATGGGSGRTSVVRLSGELAATYPVVVGAGGAAASVSDYTSDYVGVSTSGNNGGSSSFGGVAAQGGSGGSATANANNTSLSGSGGGQGSASTQCASTYSPAMGELRNTGTTYKFGDTHVLECFNPIDMKKCLIAGGYAGASYPSGVYKELALSDDYGKAGSAGISSTTQSVTAIKGESYGCGGGAAAVVMNGGCSATSAAGCDGAVFIYGR